jgi:hypothetical protein
MQAQEKLNDSMWGTHASSSSCPYYVDQIMYQVGVSNIPSMFDPRNQRWFLKDQSTTVIRRTNLTTHICMWAHL